jgi:hypothetical protein
MKWISYAISAIGVFTLQSALAAVPVTISGPVPAISSNINVGDSNTITYTITNNVPGRSFPISIAGISTPVNRTLVANDCGSNLPAGPATCNIGIIIAPTSNNTGQTVNQILSVDYHGRTPLTANIQFSILAAPVTTLLIAAGQNTNSTAPLLAESTASGANWMVQPITGITSSGLFETSACTGSGTTAICTAAGEDLTGTIPPILAQSTNGGTSWTNVSIPGITNNGEFFGSSCTGSGTTAICIAAGEDHNGTQPPLLVQSINGGANWAATTITGAPTDGSFSSASCTGTGATAICTAAGRNNTTGTPLLAQSTNGGANWSLPTITGLPSGFFFSTTCAANICLAVGQNNTTNAALLAQSIDGGAHWAIKSITGLPTFSVLQGVSCTSSGNLCIAVGQNSSTGAALLVQSSDGGANWATQAISGLPSPSIFFGASCTGSGSTAMCVAVGENLATTPPLLAQTTNGGLSWSVQAIPGLPTDGVLVTAQCTGSASTAICIAAGNNFTGANPALLIQTINGGTTWSLPAISGDPSSGNFAGTGIA